MKKKMHTLNFFKALRNKMIEADNFNIYRPINI